MFMFFVENRVPSFLVKKKVYYLRTSGMLLFGFTNQPKAVFYENLLSLVTFHNAFIMMITTLEIFECFNYGYLLFVLLISFSFPSYVAE